MKPWLNYHHLHYFYVIAKEGGISKAARALSLGQSTLSMQLKQFEEVLGKKLIARAEGKFALTEEGKIALKYAQDIFDLGDEFLQTLSDQKNPKVPHLQIGALDVLPKELIFKVVERASIEENCFVSVLEGPFDFLCRELLAHQVDLVVTDSPITGGTGSFRSRKVVEFPLKMMGAKKFSKLSKNFPQSLEGQAFVLPTRHSRLRQELEQWFEKNNLRIHCIAETQDLEVAKQFVQAGMALAVFPELGTLDDAWASELKVLARLPGMKEEIWLSTAQRKIMHPVADKLMKDFSL